MTSLTLSFNDVNLNAVARNDNQIWLSSADLAKALGYKQADSITRIYNRNKEEFSESMSQTVNLTASAETKANEVSNTGTSSKNKGLVVKTRIFSLRGAHLISMFARTKIAKDFRRWVLDILDKEVGEPKQVSQLAAIEDRKPLNEAVKTYCLKSGAIYSDVWKMIHQRFGVTKVDQLTVEQIPHAVEYIHKMAMTVDLQNDVPAFEYLTTAKAEALDYVWELQRTVKDLGGELPQFPDFDMNQLIQGFISRMFMGNRVLMSFDGKGTPAMKFVPSQHWIMTADNITVAVETVDRELMPEIIKTAAKRLG